MPNSGPNLGQIAEDWIEEICTTTFLADFTIRNPAYRKSSGQTKEAADFLVAFGDTLMVVQVKTKLVSDAQAPLDQNDLTRAAKAVGKAFQQFRAMLEAAHDPEFFTFRNARGHELRFDKTGIKNMVALVIYGLVAPDGKLSTTNLRFTKSCFPEDGIPIHLFSLREFRLLTLLADTFPDFLLYLDVRTQLHLQNLVHAHTLPIDIWASLTFEPEQLLAAMQSNAPLNLDGAHERHLPAMPGFEKAEKPSYFVDWLIEEMYDGIDAPAEFSHELVAKAKMLAPPGSLAAFQGIIPELAKLRRRDRTELAIGFREKIERAQTEGFGFRVIKFSTHEEAFLLLAMEGARQDRQVVLFNLSRAAAHKLGVRYVIGIASAPLPLCTTDYDVIISDAKEMTVDQPLIDAVNYYFGEPQEIPERPTTLSSPRKR